MGVESTSGNKPGKNNTTLRPSDVQNTFLSPFINQFTSRPVVGIHFFVCVCVGGGGVAVCVCVCESERVCLYYIHIVIVHVFV